MVGCPQLLIKLLKDYCFPVEFQLIGLEIPEVLFPCPVPLFNNTAAALCISVWIFWLRILMDCSSLERSILFCWVWASFVLRSCIFSNTSCWDSEGKCVLRLLWCSNCLHWCISILLLQKASLFFDVVDSQSRLCFFSSFFEIYFMLSYFWIGCWCSTWLFQRYVSF